MHALLSLLFQGPHSAWSVTRPIWLPLPTSPVPGLHHVHKEKKVPYKRLTELLFCMLKSHGWEQNYYSLKNAEIQVSPEQQPRHSFPIAFHAKQVEVSRMSPCPHSLYFSRILCILKPLIYSLVMPLKYSLQEVLSNSNDMDFHQLIFNCTKY